jgi:predicted nucleotidyltransferase
MNDEQLLSTRQRYSRRRLRELSDGFNKIRELKDIPKLTIFGAGSYARLEASEHSDIDMFFLTSAPSDRLKEPNTSRIKLFGKVISLVDDLQFPKFSNDGEYLKILHMSDMVDKMGGQQDDYENHFTTRMLLLLESKCLYGKPVYNGAIAKIVRSYFRDYPTHRNNFKPIFLMNDIMRYWKTLCLNYENRRRDFAKPRPRGAVIKQKVKNFKLKYSRMTTCFATIALLSCQLKSIQENDVIDLVGLTPRERLQEVAKRIPSAKRKSKEILEGYTWFLRMTSLPTIELDKYFADERKRRMAFRRANSYGDKVFDLLKVVDHKYDTFRYLVI